MLGSLGRWLRALQRRLRLRKRSTRAVSDCLRSCPAWRKVRNHEPSFLGRAGAHAGPSATTEENFVKSASPKKKKVSAQKKRKLEQQPLAPTTLPGAQNSGDSDDGGMEKKKQRLENTAETQEPVGKAAEEDSNSRAKVPAAEAPTAVPAPAQADGAGAAGMDVATSADETAQGSSADEASETYVPCHPQR